MRLRSLESRVFLGLVLVTTAFFIWVVRSFLMPVFWAAVFAILFRPVFVRTLPIVGNRRGIAAFLTTITVILVVLIPSILLVAAVAQQAVGLYERFAAGEINVEAPIAFIEGALPPLADLLARYGIDVDRIRTAVEAAAVTATQYVASQALAIGQNALTVAILFGLMLYVLFFFIRDGEKIIAAIIRALPMGDEREQRLFDRFADVSRATVKGTLIVAMVQGILGGILFAVVGVQAAVFWGVAMGVLSLLPAVGPALVWVPAAIFFFATNAVWQGALIVVGGTLVVGLVDNLLRPILVGRGAKMPDYLVLLATLGGLTAFGLAGFVAGPIIAALFLVMWEMFADEYAPLDTPATGAEVERPRLTARAADEATETETAGLPDDKSGGSPVDDQSSRLDFQR